MMRIISARGLIWAALFLCAVAFFASAPSRVLAGPPTARIVRVPILMYHYIRVNPNPRDRFGADLSVRPDMFAQQMKLLAADGFHTMTIDDLAAIILNGAPLPSNPIILTFDDGYEDFYTAAFPVLKKYGLGATSFVITGKVGWGGYLTWDQMRKMQATGLVQFESHTVHHVEMTGVSLARAEHELSDSKAALERELGTSVDVFCYPSGRYNERVESLVRQEGYIAGGSTRPGMVHNVGDLDALTRVRIHGSDTLKDFARKVGASLVASGER
jgi:peptidoglycan/xylan/chitin deacetylase (PgdA/CDA1 family)